MGAQLKVVERGFARRQKHDMAATLRKLTKESDGAVETLVALMASEDEKIRLGAASKIIDLQRQIANDINTDDLQRLIANVKFGGPKELEVDDGPEVDFSIVHETRTPS